MTQAEINEMIGQHRHGGYVALAIATVERCHDDIKCYQRLHTKYSELPALTPYQRDTLQRAAIDSTGGRRFLDCGWAVRMATGQ